MQIRVLHRALVCSLALLLSFQSAARGADRGDDHGTSSELVRVTAAVAHLLPSAQLTIEAEGGDYETMLTVTLLDHLPDWRRPADALRRLLR